MQTLDLEVSRNKVGSFLFVAGWMEAGVGWVALCAIDPKWRASSSALQRRDGLQSQLAKQETLELERTLTSCCRRTRRQEEAWCYIALDEAVPVDVFQLRIEIKELDEAASRLDAAAENESAGLKSALPSYFKTLDSMQLKKLCCFCRRAVCCVYPYWKLLPIIHSRWQGPVWKRRVKDANKCTAEVKVGCELTSVCTPPIIRFLFAICPARLCEEYTPHQKNSKKHPELSL